MRKTQLKILDIYPKLKTTLLQDCDNYREFIDELLKQRTVYSQEEFNVMLCELYNTEELFAVMNTIREYAILEHKEYSEILNAVFKALYNDYTKALKRKNMHRRVLG